MSQSGFKVADLALAEQGRLRIDWAESHMPVLMSLRKEAEQTRPLAGHRVSGCIHVTKETAVLVRTLRAAGASVAWAGCNPLTTQDDVAAALAAEGFTIFGWHGMSTTEMYWCIERTLDHGPTLTLDDGADLTFMLHTRFPHLAAHVYGGTEETTTGVHRLRGMAAAGQLRYPVVAVNDAETKWDFDNVYGTGQSTIDGILRATAVMLAAKTFVVGGYGRCGRGLALRAQGMGARVICTEIEPTRALKAVFDGFEVLSMDQAAPLGDVFCTATGMRDVIVGRHFQAMKDGAIVCNTGHYDCEVNVSDLEALARGSRTVRPDTMEYTLRDGHNIYLLAQGRLVNLAAAEGHPSEVMDMSFANQFLGLLLVAREGRAMAPQVHKAPSQQDEELARHKLRSLGVVIDSLTPAQLAYREDASTGT